LIPENYKGREQAFIKHTLLKAYLERLFMIIGKYHKRICYVDCFAGPWQDEGVDLEDTSIAIAIDIMRKCRVGLQSKFNTNISFRALFIEKDERAFLKLSTFLKKQNYEGIQTEAFNGDFFELRQNILKWCGPDDFAFFFIDPTGWSNVVEIPTLRPLLERSNSEYLINFMFDFVVRSHTQEPLKNRMLEIFGEVPNTEGMTPKERESHLLKLYCGQLKQAQSSNDDNPRSAYVKVLDPYKNRTKYHLVYLTRHPKGITVFMEESEKVDFIQREVRAKTKQDRCIENSGQTEMFAASCTLSEDDKRDLEVVKNYWLSRLSLIPKKFGIDELADMLEETGWFKSDFQNAFKELERENKVKNIDAKGKRHVNAVNFENGEFLKRT
jgi:three-Cys-motif partner protein